MSTTWDLSARIGQELGVSRWITVDQAMIDAFAGVTGDNQFIHTDPARAAATPFGGTVAHGFLTLSLLPVMAYEVLSDLVDGALSINYGFDRLRFLAPVPAGARVRGRFTLAEATMRAPGRLMLATDVKIEIEGHEKPAIAAIWRNLFIQERNPA